MAGVAFVRCGRCPKAAHVLRLSLQPWMPLALLELSSGVSVCIAISNVLLLCVCVAGDRL